MPFDNKTRVAQGDAGITRLCVEITYSEYICVCMQWLNQVSRYVNIV